MERWDALEALVIRVYRSGRACEADTREYAALRAWLRSHHPPVAPRLEPHWRGVEAGGAPVEADPFASLYGRASAEDFVGDWPAMQLLPAAREALNGWLLAGAAP